MNEHYIKEWVIPFYHNRIKNWDHKKVHLLSLFDKSKDNMIMGDQHTDYDSKNNYHSLVEALLMDDLKDAFRNLNVPNDITPRVTSSWFQYYDKGEHHAVHNHAIGGYSMVCFINYDRMVHRPTTFICPFLSFWDGNVREYCPNDVDEGSIIIFPSALPHYVPPNKSEDQRLILSCNIKC